MIAKVILSLALVGSAVSFPRPDNIPSYNPAPVNTHKIDPYGKNPYKEEAKRPYAFDYGVHDDYTGANFGHQEDSDGNTIKGSYSVALPDGRIQKVNYVADHYNGFQAEVTYEGEATYPETQTGGSQYGPPQPHFKAQPQYSNPAPSYQPSPRYKDEPQVYGQEQVISEY